MLDATTPTPPPHTGSSVTFEGLADESSGLAFEGAGLVEGFVDCLDVVAVYNDSVSTGGGEGEGQQQERAGKGKDENGLLLFPILLTDNTCPMNTLKKQRRWRMNALKKHAQARWRMNTLKKQARWRQGGGKVEARWREHFLSYVRTYI